MDNQKEDKKEEGLFMKRLLKRKKIFGAFSVVALVFIFGFSTVSLAYNEPYSFNIRSAVTGEAKHKLSNKSTTITASARTIKAETGETLSQTHKYTVTISKGVFTSYSTGRLTTGKSYSKNVGKVAKGTYRVNVTKHTYSDYGINIKGGGRIKQ